LKEKMIAFFPLFGRKKVGFPFPFFESVRALLFFFLLAREAEKHFFPANGELEISGLLINKMVCPLPPPLSKMRPS